MDGPTETTVWSSVWRVQTPRDGISIGEAAAFFLLERDAEALVPLELLELCNLVGPESYVKERIAAFKESGVTNLQIMPVGDDPAALVSQMKEWVS